MYLLVLQHILAVARGLFLRHEGSPAVVCRLSCPLACGLLASPDVDQTCIPCIGRGGSLPTGPPGKPQIPHLGHYEASSHTARGSLDSSELMRSKGDRTLANYLGNNSTQIRSRSEALRVASHTKTSNFFFSLFIAEGPETSGF